jgi:small subunit ribosomal protein S5
MAEKVRTISRDDWEPRTSLGKKVKAGEISSIDEIIDSGEKILEHEIVDVLMSDMESETLQIARTQRVTDSGKRMKFRVTSVIGDRKGHVGIGIGKSEELKPALDYAVRNAKKNMTSIPMGCGSWECKCSIDHSIRRSVTGKEGSTEVTLKPAPRGLGLAANDVVKKILGIAGVNDVWSSTHGGKGNVYNMAAATMNALENINTIKPPAE